MIFVKVGGIFAQGPGSEPPAEAARPLAAADASPVLHLDWEEAIRASLRELPAELQPAARPLA